MSPHIRDGGTLDDNAGIIKTAQNTSVIETPPAQIFSNTMAKTWLDTTDDTRPRHRSICFSSYSFVPKPSTSLRLPASEWLRARPT
jgi:hypothetical protein